MRAWVPVPLTTNTDYFKREPDSWTGNYKSAKAVQYDKYGTGMVFAEWSGQVHAPQPRRIETEELDAEWMAHCRDERWLLSRRELIEPRFVLLRPWRPVAGADRDDTTDRLVKRHLLDRRFRRDGWA